MRVQLRNFIVLFFIAIFLSACVTTPTGGKQLSETGKIALQSVAEISVRRYLRDHPGRQTNIVSNIRRVAGELQSATSVTTVSGLRSAVEAELQKIPMSDADRQDATSLLNIFEALLREQIGSETIDSQGLIKVNDFLKMIVGALPAT